LSFSGLFAYPTKVISFIILLLTFSQGCQEKYLYKVKKIVGPVKINAIWNKRPWQDIEPLRLSHYMGKKPIHFPDVSVKLAYDNSALYIIYKVFDKYIRARHLNYQGPVYEDSCVEFFFTPNRFIRKGYFNLEINCIGTALFHHQLPDGSNLRNIGYEDFREIQIATSIRDSVFTEIQTDSTWYLEYSIPFTIIEKYARFDRPDTGVQWRVNFYKIADKSSHPHWLTWSPVDFPRPNFHLPQFFGILQFE
jgi:hypothetical protein